VENDKKGILHTKKSGKEWKPREKVNNFKKIFKTHWPVAA
jgi:hypothetical protein